ncbi:MAG: hypothetical protein OXD32_03785 [Endozoicomonadaceae bacterium]|nr:hypothetical protein [Endozoicomonadaceae bacterium]
MTVSVGASTSSACGMHPEKAGNGMRSAKAGNGAHSGKTGNDITTTQKVYACYLS